MELIRKMRIFLRSPLSIICLVSKRFHLRLKGLRFGHGLTLEGNIEVTAAKRVQLGRCVRLGKDIYLGVWMNLSQMEQAESQLQYNYMIPAESDDFEADWEG